MEEENAHTMNLDLILGPVDNSSDGSEPPSGSYPNVAMNLEDWLDGLVHRVRKAVRQRHHRWHLNCIRLYSFGTKKKSEQMAVRQIPRPWLFVGLGNPGQRFMGSRHNVGFEFIDAFAKAHGIAMDSIHCKAIFGKGFVNDVPVFLAKPQTYMNLSGESSGPLAAYYKLPLNRVLVLHDDMDLPCGVLRFNPLGNHGSHNGLKSVIHHFRENREFPRLRIGIGKPAGQMDPKAFLLQNFNARARERIDAALEEGVDGLTQVLLKGLEETARCFNKDQKYKHLSLQQTMPV